MKSTPCQVMGPVVQINHTRAVECMDHIIIYNTSCTLSSTSAVGVFRFWTFLKSSCFRSLYGALDLKNNYCAKKIRKFYLLAIAHGG